MSWSALVAVSRQAEEAVGRTTIEVTGAEGGWGAGARVAVTLVGSPPARANPKAKPSTSPTAKVTAGAMSSHARRLRGGACNSPPAAGTPGRVPDRARLARTAMQAAAGRDPSAAPPAPRRRVPAAARSRGAPAPKGSPARAARRRGVVRPGSPAWFSPRSLTWRSSPRGHRNRAARHRRSVVEWTGARRDAQAHQCLAVTRRPARPGGRGGFRRWCRRRSARRPGPACRPAPRPAGTAPPRRPRSARRGRWPAGSRR
jgi:hypothetical protein